jgi:hypothetical protein
MFEINSEKLSINRLQQQLELSLPSIKYDRVLCPKKGKNESNIKPVDVTKFNGIEVVNVYRVCDHLSMFLANEKLSKTLIFKPVSNELHYTSFVSGNYFHNFALGLIVGEALNIRFTGVSSDNFNLVHNVLCNLVRSRGECSVQTAT